MSNHYAPVTSSPINDAQIGTTFTRIATGWAVKWVDGGTVITVQGPTIEEALASHGLHVVHPVKEIPQGIVETVRPEPPKPKAVVSVA